MAVPQSASAQGQAPAAHAPCAVSIIIPAYNVRPFLQRALASALHQTLRPLEIIVVDDGSTDGTSQLCDDFLSRYPQRLSVVHQGNQGVSAARNRGLELACGEYVSFLDGDDYLAEDFCERLYRRACAERADICRGVTWRCYPNGESHADNGMQAAFGLFGSRLFFLYYMFSAIYKKSFLDEHGIRFEEGIVLCEDNLFVNQAVLSCRHLALDNEAYYYYCRRLGSADSVSISHRQLQSVAYVYQKMTDNLNRCCGPSDRHGLAYVYWNLIHNLQSISGRAVEPRDAAAARSLAEVIRAKCSYPEDLELVERCMAAQAGNGGAQLPPAPASGPGSDG